MSEKHMAIIDIVRAVAGIPLAVLAAVGSASGNLLFAGLATIPAATLMSYDTISTSIKARKLQSQKEELLELPMPSWWKDNLQSWQSCCTEIEQRLPDVLKKMMYGLKHQQGFVTEQNVQQAFIEALADEPLHIWTPTPEERKRIAESIATPLLTGLDQVLKPIIQEIRQNTALEDISSMRSVISPHPLNDEEINRLQQQYCDVLYDQWRMLDFRGIMHIDMNRPISMPLVEVFVFPDVLPGIPEYETLEREAEKFIYGDYPQRIVRGMAPQRQPFETALANHSQLVILGDPGSGKSTLLRYLLLLLVQGRDTFISIFPQLGDLATLVPLYIPLSAYAQVLLSNTPGTRSFEDFVPSYLQDNYLGSYTILIKELMEQGKMLLLLDGLDEIPDTTLRLSVVRHIEMFTHAYKGNCFIVTSRIVGYKEAALTSEYQAYTLADFNEDQIKIFTQKWCPAYECWVRGIEESKFLKDAATKEAEKLFSATQSRPAVQRLAVNPLLLTILALIQRQGIELPSHRVELFNLCVMTLIDTWVMAKGQSTLFSKNDLIKILRPLAFWMHEHPAVGAIPEEELHEKIVQQLIERGNPGHEANKLAEQFLQTVRGKTGILVERGKERYGFLHLTFEEYLAARELEKRKDRNTFIKSHLHDPRWREVILLTVGAIGILLSNEEEVTDLVQNIIAKAGNIYEGTLHRDLLFAGHCLADDVGVSIVCENEIIEQIVYDYLTSPFNQIREACSDVLVTWRGTRKAIKATDLIYPLLSQWASANELKSRFLVASGLGKALEEHIERLVIQYQEFTMKLLRFHLTIMLAHLKVLDTVDWMQNLLGVFSDTEIQEKAASILRQLDGGEAAAMEVSLIALTDPDAFVRSHSVLALGQLGEAHPRIIDALLLATSDQNYEVRKCAVSVLGQLGEIQPSVIDTLLEMLSWRFSRKDVVCALGQLSKGQPRVVDALLLTLHDVDSWSVRQATANTLAIIGQGHPKVIDELLIALADPDEDVRKSVSQALKPLYESKPEPIVNSLLTAISNSSTDARQIIAELLGQLSSNPSYVTQTLLLSLADQEEAKVVAILSLGFLGMKESQVVETLLSFLSNSNKDIQYAAVDALSLLGDTSAQVIDALLNILDNPQSWLVRGAAVAALGQLGNNESRIIDALLIALTDSSSWHVRIAAATALGQLGEEQPHIIYALLSTLLDPDEDVRTAANNALRRFDKENSRIHTYLKAALFDSDLVQHATERYRQNLYSSVTERILELLRDVESDQVFIIDMLFDILSSKPKNVRTAAASTLGQIGKKNPQIVDRLLSLLSDPDWKVREIAVKVCEKLCKEQPLVLNALLLALSDSDEDVREAAATALGRLSEEHSLIIDPLLKALSDSNHSVKAAAARSLGSVGKKQPQVIDALLQTLFDPKNGDVRNSSAIALFLLNDDEPRVIEALLQAFFSTSLQGRDGIAIALGRLGKEQTHVLDTLLTATSNPDPSIRLAAIKALGYTDKKGNNIIHALLLTIEDPGWPVREETARAFSNIGDKQPSIINSLLARLSDPSSSVRKAAAQALRSIGSGDSDIIADLLPALSDADWSVREEVAFTLATLLKGNEAIAERVKQLLHQYEPIAQRENGGYHSIFNALQAIAEKT